MKSFILINTLIIKKSYIAYVKRDGKVLEVVLHDGRKMDTEFENEHYAIEAIGEIAKELN